MTTRSFVRFGGLAGVLLALTSLTSVLIFAIMVPTEQRLPIADAHTFLVSLARNSTGTLLFNGLYALIALWAVFGIGATYYRVRAAGPAWAAFATVIGEIAAVGTIAGGLYQLASLRYIASLVPTNLAAAQVALGAPSPINPLGVMTFGLTGLWFLLVSLLMPQTDLPRLLVVVGFVAFADLAVGFVASVVDAGAISTLAAVIAGAVGGPVFWLWLGLILMRDAEKLPAESAEREHLVAALRNQQG